MYSETHFRQSEFLPEESLKVPIVMIGAGGIGSPTVLALAKMGFEDITVYDDDLIEAHNTGAQLYGMDDEGTEKVVALRDLIGSMTDVLIEDMPVLFDADADYSNSSIVISGVDSMKARQDIWKTVEASYPAWYIDARMSLQDIRIYCVDMNNPGDYAESLHSDDEGTGTACSARSVAYNGMFCASVVAAMVSKIVRGETPPTQVIGDLSVFGLTTIL